MWTTIGELLINRDNERIPLSLAVRKQQSNKQYDYYGAAGVIDKVSDYLFSEKLLLIGEDGANLLSRSKNNAFFADGKYWVNNHAHVLDCTLKQILTYVAFVINSMSLEPYITGSAQPKLSQDNLNRIPIPLPPLTEQNNIICSTEKWFAFIEELEKEKSSLQEIVKYIKAKILDLAIHGKLVPQDPNDEPAIELLRRINPDFQSCDNAHYKNLPESWTVIQVSQISKLLSGRDIPNNLCNAIGKGIPYLIGASNIVDNNLEITRWTEMPQVIAKKNDVLISCKGTIGQIIKNDIGRVHIARQFMAIRPNADCIDPDYLLLCVFAIVEEIKKDARGVIPGISRDDILLKQIPIPPINEQQRIYNVIKQYNKILDNIIAEL